MGNRKIAIERQIYAVSLKRKAKKYKVAYHYLTIQANPRHGCTIFKVLNFHIITNTNLI